MVVTDNLPTPTENADSEILRALRGGDGEAFRQLVTDLNPGLTRLARTYVPPALADEVVQEAWAAVITALDDFEGRSSLKTWVYRIMLNKVRTLAKRESKIVPFAAVGSGRGSDEPAVAADELVDPAKGPGFWPAPPDSWHLLPADVLEQDEVIMMVLEAIEALSPAQREVVELRDVQGFSAAETSEALGISAVNQRVLLHRGRSAVRSKLARYLADD